MARRTFGDLWSWQGELAAAITTGSNSANGTFWTKKVGFADRTLNLLDVLSAMFAN